MFRSARVVVCAVIACASAALGAVPGQLMHQGVIAVNGERFTGEGAFRFVLVDADTDTYLWVNDGSAVNDPDAPTNPVLLPVINGVYQAALGNTLLNNMTAIPLNAFHNNQNVVLRVWFDNQSGGGMHVLTPDQPVSATPFAQYAAVSEQLNIPGMDTAAVTVGVNGDVTIPADLTVNGGVGGTGFSGWDTNAANDVTTTTLFSGDMTGSFNSTVVGNDSHSHADSTISDSITINNGRLYAPTGSGAVGIGTAAPTASRLHVVGGSGDATVTVPSSAISALERLDEAGVASVSVTSTFTLAGGGYASILARTMTLPASGYVLAIATFNLSMENGGLSTNSAILGLAVDSTTPPSDANHVYAAFGSDPAQWSSSIHHVFTVGAGTFTFRFVGQRFIGHADDEIDVFDRRLTLVYFPTAYGAVTATEPGNEGLATAAGVADGFDDGVGLDAMTAFIRRVSERDAAGMSNGRDQGLVAPSRDGEFGGVVTLDANGQAWVELPPTDAAADGEYRYQLTCIGGHAGVYVAEEVHDGAFQIGGGYAGLKVSWQVTRE